MPFDPDTSIGGGNGRFPRTRQTLLAALRGEDEAERQRVSDTLVALYWKPLYKHLRLGSNRSNEDAKDLVQGFFAYSLEKSAFDGYEPEKGTFRTFIRTLFDRYVANQAKAAGALKRGGREQHLDFDEAEAELNRTIPDDSVSADELLHREWVRSLFSMAVERLRSANSAGRKALQFQVFELYDLQSSEAERISYAQVASRFGIAETAVTNYLAAMRRQFRQIALDVLREVTASEAEYRREAQTLFGKAH